jgi:hypothetical protein
LKVTVPLVRVQALLVVDGSIEKLTGPPPVAVAAGLEVSPIEASDGAGGLKVMVCADEATVMVCAACPAEYEPFPTWSAATTQLPAWTKVTVLPEMVQAALVVDGSTEYTIGLPDAPPVAAAA